MSTTTAELIELINTEQIENVIAEENRFPAMFRQLGWLHDMSQQQANVFQMPQWDLTDPPAGTKVENATFTEVTADPTAVTIAGGTVGLSRKLSDEANVKSIAGLVDMIGLNSRGMEERINTDMLAEFSTFTNTTSFLGLPFDLDAWGTVTSAFAGQAPHNTGAWVAVLSLGQHRDLKNDIRSAGGNIEATGRALQLFTPEAQGLVGSFEGYTIFSSGLNPAFDGANDLGGLIVVGNETVDPASGMSERKWSTLVAASWWGIRHRPQREEQDAATLLVTSAHFGVGTSIQANGRSFESLN